MVFEKKNKLDENYPFGKIRQFGGIVLVSFLTLSMLPLLYQVDFEAVAQTQQNASSSEEAPVEGYIGRIQAVDGIRHVYDDPTLRVYHYCTPNDKILMVCQLYDSSSPNATLIGIEYMITPQDYKALPDRDKPNWHYHQLAFSPDRAAPHFPQLSPEQEQTTLKSLADTYGKVIITWNPNDKLPAFPPQEQIVQHPDIVNATVPIESETGAGSFNQTLNY